MRGFAELFANVAVGCAAIALIWHVFLRATTTPTSQNGPQPVEDISVKKQSLTIGESARKGDHAAGVVLIEFSDYECPFCGRYALDTFDRIDKAFVSTNRVQYVLRNFPLGIHKQALAAAQAAECAGAQGKYWGMHRALFSKQQELGETLWEQEATSLRLDASAFKTCLNGEMLDKVKRDASDGAALGVRATPTFFVGHRQNDGVVALVSKISGAQPFAIFEKALNDALHD